LSETIFSDQRCIQPIDEFRIYWNIHCSFWIPDHPWHCEFDQTNEIAQAIIRDI
jgi:hypothetical protein